MAGYLYRSNGDLLLLHEKYSDEEITRKINEVILNKESYCFYIVYPVDEIGDAWGENPKYCELSINQLSEVKRAKLANERTKITIKNNRGGWPRTAQIPMDYTKLLGCEFDEDGQSPATRKTSEWEIEARKIADVVGLERWHSGIREITKRGICDEIATRLGKNSEFWGKKGVRSGGNVRLALTGWSFNPPKEDD